MEFQQYDSIVSINEYFLWFTCSTIHEEKLRCEGYSSLSSGECIERVRPMGLSVQITSDGTQEGKVEI
jgi:hypothetical protein